MSVTATSTSSGTSSGTPSAGASTAASSVEPSTEMLALPSAERQRPRNVLNLGVLLSTAAGLMALAGLVAAYVALRSLTTPWPPENVRYDLYVGTVLAGTALLSAFAIEWGNWANGRGSRRQTVFALLLTFLLGLALLNALWFQGSVMGFGPGDHPYGAVAWSMLALAALVTVVGVALLGATTGRVLGGQITQRDHEQLRATAWYWHFVVVTMIIVWYVLFISK